MSSLSGLPPSLAASFESFSKHPKFYHFCVGNEGILSCVILLFQYLEHFVLLGKWITGHSQMQTKDVTKDSLVGSSVQV